MKSCSCTGLESDELATLVAALKPAGERKPPTTAGAAAAGGASVNGSLSPVSPSEAAALQSRDRGAVHTSESKGDSMASPSNDRREAITPQGSPQLKTSNPQTNDDDDEITDALCCPITQVSV